MNNDIQNDSSDRLKEAIRNAGLRATPARMATLSLLQMASTPMTHAEVATQLEAKGIDKATVFRNLNDLVSSGLLRRTELGDHVWRFEVIGEHEHGGTAHPHFVCTDCGVVACMGEVKLTASSLKVSQEFGEVREILLRGLCHECG